MSCDHAEDAFALSDGRTTEWNKETLRVYLTLGAVGTVYERILQKHTLWEEAGLSLQRNGSHEGSRSVRDASWEEARQLEEHKCIFSRESSSFPFLCSHPNQYALVGTYFLTHILSFLSSMYSCITW